MWYIIRKGIYRMNQELYCFLKSNDTFSNTSNWVGKKVGVVLIYREPSNLFLSVSAFFFGISLYVLLFVVVGINFFIIEYFRRIFFLISVRGRKLGTLNKRYTSFLLKHTQNVTLVMENGSMRSSVFVRGNFS